MRNWLTVKTFTSRLALHTRYVSNLSFTFVSQAVTALSALILTPMLVKELGPQQFSIYGVILNLIIFSSIFDFGLNTGLLRKLIHDINEKEKLISVMFFFYIFSFLLAIPFYIYLFNTGYVKVANQEIFTPIFVAIIVVQNILAVLFDVIIQSVNKIYVGKIIRIIRTLIEFTLLFIFCKKGSVILLLMLTASVNLLYLITLFIYSKKEVNYTLSIQYFSWPTLRSHLYYCFWYFQSAIASVMVFNAQIILISNFIDSVNVAKYLLVTKFYEIIGVGIANFTIVLFPSLSNLQAQGNWLKLKQTFLSVVFRVSIMVIIIFAFILTIGQKIFIYWSNYNDALILNLFQFYSVFVAIIIIEHVPTVFLSALKLNKWPSMIATIQGVLGLLISYMLLPKYGIIGAIVASLISFVLTNCWFNPYYLIRSLNQKIKVY